MNANKLCRECGKPLGPEALLDLCPECLMKAGLATAPKATIRVAPDAFVEGQETETKEFTTGTKLGYIGDYELLEEIARGGMGVVYKARQSSLKRIVAVKMIRSGELAGEAEVKRFHTEAEAAAQLQHPGIVAIHEIGEHEGRHYFSMDFVEGKNLAQVANGKPVAAQSAAEWLKAIAEAVQYAHQRGVLHRDLKPQNIMVDAAGHPRVTDFGLAKNLGSDSTLTNTGAVMGSPSYMSPEQARGRNDLIGPASDVYSLGAILYELLTGRPPFRGKTPIDTMSQVVNDEPPRPRSLNPGTPVDLETICLKCLEKEPVRRYPTARELEADLGRFLAGEPVQARPANAFRRTVSWFRRHPWMLSAVLSVLILTLLGLAYGLWEQTRFLTWLNAHPGYVRAPGPRAARMEATDSKLLDLIIGLLLVVFPLILIYRKLVTRKSWQNVFETLQLHSWFFAAYGSACIALALFKAKETIEVWVWEGVWSGVFGTVLFFCFGLRLLLTSVRQLRRIQIEPRQEDKRAPVSPEQLASIHEAIFARRTRDALKLYRAAFGDKATGQTAGREQRFTDRVNLLKMAYQLREKMRRRGQDIRDLAKMEAELRRACPEKFLPVSANQADIWIIYILMLPAGVCFLTGQSLWPLLMVLMGVVIGGLIRDWKTEYRKLSPGSKVGAWFLAVCFAVTIVGLILNLLTKPVATGAGILSIITDPQVWPVVNLLLWFTCGILAGWLMVHLRLKKRKGTKTVE